VLNVLATGLALLIITAWLFIAAKHSPQSMMLKIMVLFVTTAYVINCAICATLATVANRFGARLSWMFVLLAVLICFDLIAAKRKRHLN
jgi:hypothetical protein